MQVSDGFVLTQTQISRGLSVPRDESSKYHFSTEEAFMRLMARLSLFILFPLLVRAATSGRVVLEPANVGSQPQVMTVSTTSETGFAFRLAGVEISESATEDGVAYQSVAAITDDPKSFGQTDEEGYPELPLYARFVAIPDRAGIDIEIISAEYQTISDIDIVPCQPSEEDENGPIDFPFAKDASIYQQDKFYPEQPVVVGEPMLCRDLRLAQAIVQPIQYNAYRRELRVYTNIDYRLNYAGEDVRNQKIRRNNKISESFLPMYQALVPNANEMLASYQPVRGGYLIISPDIIPDSLTRALARWKHLKGYSTVITKATDIDPDGGLASQQVYDYIQNAYNTWDSPPEYVCILGDIDMQIPDFGYYGYVSDHPYECVDGTDYFSDIMVTRMSVPATLTTIRTAIYKSIIYERNPNMADPAYWLRGLSSAANITSGGAPSRTPRLNVLWVREQLMRHGFTRVDTSFAWDGYDPGTAVIINAINSGVSMISYRGWGGPYSWGGPGFSTSDLEALNLNNKMSVMASLTCGTGEYGFDECFGEKWIRMGALPSALKGGPGFFGATESGTHTKYDNPLMIGYYWSILEEGIYNFANAAFMGKMELYNTFPREHSGTIVQRFFYTFNTLGEPEFELRTATPQTMTVTYPSTLPVGSSIMTVHVTGSGSVPLENAYVNLVKGYGVNEQIFVGGRTNASGDITLNFAAITADTMFVTVTARNYIPHVGNALVQNQATAVNVDNIALDDDTNGNSSGNSDGNANPGETVEFAVTLRNFGNSIEATNVQAVLTSASPEFNITVGTQNYGNIAIGATATSGSFAAHLTGNIPNGEHFILNLAITSDQGSWSAAIPVDIKNMMFAQTGIAYPGNSNGILDPGETSNLVVTLQNLGELAGNSLIAILSSADTSVTISSNSASFGNIAIGASGSNTSSPFIVTAGPNVYEGHNVNFNMTLTSSSGAVATRAFSATIGSVATNDPQGPDDYGYYLYDNTDASYSPAPFYEWIEISPFEGGSGTRITFPFSTDDDAVVVNLPFNLRYYGQDFSYALVSINGFIAFDTTRMDSGRHRWTSFDNNQIPEPGAPDGIIAPFWDDLEYTGSNGVFQYFDNANNRYIIEWKNCTHPNAPGNHPETFQLIINNPATYPTPTGDAEIIFQYHTVYNDDTDTWDPDAPGLYCTVGCQNLRNNDGLLYTYDNFYNPAAATLAAGRAIKITTATGFALPPELSYNPIAIHANALPGESTTEAFNISNIGAGNLIFSLHLTPDIVLDSRGHNTPSEQIQSQPIGYYTPPSPKPLDINQPTYPPVIADQGGPDAFGYSWIDSDELGGPTYQWVDITGVGTQITLGDESVSAPLDFGFDFPFYGEVYTFALVSSDGVLTFTEGTTQYTNGGIPDIDAPNAMVAMYWDDLNPGAGGTVYYYADNVNGRFIVSFVAVQIYGVGNSALSFEVILYPSGRIRYVYNTLVPGDGSLASCTIGIENLDGTDGLQVAYNSAYLHNALALEFVPPVRWMSCDINSGGVRPGNTTAATLSFTAAELTEGTYTGHIDLDSNDPDEGSLDIPITFIVGPPQGCQYVIGDINGNGTANGIDVTYGVTYFKGGNNPPITCDCPGHGVIFAGGDVNGNCVFNGIDITYFVGYLKGGSPLIPCADCPPALSRTISPFFEPELMELKVGNLDK
jgi:hypothetical protein